MIALHFTFHTNTNNNTNTNFNTIIRHTKKRMISKQNY